MVFVGVNGQIDWQAQQISHLVCSLAGQRYLEAWETFWTWRGHSITPLIAGRNEELREAADIPPSEVGNHLCSTRQTPVLSRGQPPGDAWETVRSTYGPIRAVRCYLELKLKLKLQTELAVPSYPANGAVWVNQLTKLAMSRSHNALTPD